MGYGVDGMVKSFIFEGAIKPILTFIGDSHENVYCSIR